MVLSRQAGRNIAVLGATGSIGVNTLDVVRRFPERFGIVGLAAGWNVRLLSEQVTAHRPKIVSVAGSAEAEELRRLIGPDQDVEIVWGDEGLCRVAAMPEAETVVSAVVGAVGLNPTMAAVREGKRVALANKETLVMAGQLVVREAESNGAEILPVDSEHSAIFQALAGQRLEDVKRIILTASGGPFRDWSPEALAGVTRDQALKHPNWSMGAKISVDSATLMNKGLEAIEARWMFNLPWDKITIHVHPQSIVHSLVEFVDGSVLAQLGMPDMRVPIAYALSYPERLPLDLPRLDLTETEGLTFFEPDADRFPCLGLALEAGRRGGTCPVKLNAANEVAVHSFLDGDLTYPDIHAVVAHVVNENGTEPLDHLDQVILADREARASARTAIANIKRSRN